MSNNIRHFEMASYRGLLIPISLGGWAITSDIQWFAQFVRANSLAAHPVYLADSRGRAATHGETKLATQAPHKVHVRPFEQEIANAHR